jgi:hypothetical protein
MVAPVHNLAAMGGGGGGQGTEFDRFYLFLESSEAAIGGGARSAPLGVAMSPKNGCAQRTGAHARPKPTSCS